MPAPPVSVSLPPAPFSVLIPLLPVMTLARLLPLPSMSALPVSVRFSRSGPSVKLTLASTVSTPPVSSSGLLATKMSKLPLLSPATRLLARPEKATNRPSAENMGSRLALFAWLPSAAVATRLMAPVCRSLTKTSEAPLVSPATRLLARLSKVTNRPSAESTGLKLELFAWLPSAAVEARLMAPVCRSLTKTSKVPLVSFVTRSMAKL